MKDKTLSDCFCDLEITALEIESSIDHLCSQIDAQLDAFAKIDPEFARILEIRKKGDKNNDR